MRISRSRVAKTIAATLAVGVIVTACGSERGQEGDGGKPFVFGAAGDPRSLDPSLASDGETFRVTRQAFEALIEHEPGGSEMAPGLAEKWSSNDAGTEWTFNLRKDVKFHDGEDFNAAAVCANYDRWYNWKGVYQFDAISYYWQKVFDGFAENENEELPESNYAGCEAKDDHTAVIKVNKATANLPGGFSLQAFAIHSPKAIAAYEKDKPSGAADAINYPKYTQEAGTVAGTGPFRIAKWNKGNKEITLEKFDDYWGDKAKVDKLVFRTIDTEDGRRQALQAGNIQGYDLVAPGDVKKLADQGFQVPVRDVFNIFYLAFTEEQNKAFADKKVRMAIAHAIDKENIVNNQLPDGGKVATQFMPDTIEGYSEKIQPIKHDPAQSKKLLDEAGVKNLKIDFCYPTEVTRPYMPAPADIFQIMKSDLEGVGIKVNPKPMKWNPDYIETTRDGKCGLYLLGWTGDFNDGYNFIGTWFGGYQKEWGFRDNTVFKAVKAAGAEPDVAKRVELYKKANEVIMDYLPGIPISSSPPSIAFGKDVNPPKVSPLTQENFAEASFK
ncbi:ABC transporter substrate-binding protein [Streptomyces alkaliterrae]|uniref:ABC transporter substrate-binding protein n=1 Tax=Streptomyces alkaliterrae TaxID=2213162 RepID=A0A5P0YPE2_9ACTN|nr:ABC transporter substrate-binding protein [Streptomyces alkaliterrae]MBB1255415.1 ABC transporter substrate-binding protein [Streptomyces alkaliterrae]MBB1258702.1 ABC transporter substrate-binding protein [Streptomyces alkaliterrae]MQS02186.1 ABC transporter substrate-binding protein [Streptomyces alkaliterrae]